MDDVRDCVSAGLLEKQSLHELGVSFTVDCDGFLLNVNDEEISLLIEGS